MGKLTNAKNQLYVGYICKLNEMLYFKIIKFYVRSLGSGQRKNLHSATVVSVYVHWLWLRDSEGMVILKAWQTRLMLSAWRVF